MPKEYGRLMVYKGAGASDPLMLPYESYGS